MSERKFRNASIGVGDTVLVHGCPIEGGSDSWIPPLPSNIGRIFTVASMDVHTHGILPFFSDIDVLLLNNDGDVVQYIDSQYLSIVQKGGCD